MNMLNLEQYQPDDALDCLKPNQQALIAQLLKKGDEEDAAKVWLSSAGPLSIQKFGGDREPGGDAFFDRFCSEFRKFICGSERYDEQRKELMAIADPAIGYVVTAISVAVGSTLGIAAGLLLPAVALLLRVVIKFGVNAWCDAP